VKKRLATGAEVNFATLSLYFGGESDMAFAERRKLYEELEKARGGRPLIVYLTSTRPGIESLI